MKIKNEKKVADNIAAFLPLLAKKNPDKPAIIFPSSLKINNKRAYLHYTYAQLNRVSDEIAAGLLAAGFKENMRIVLMVKPNLEFFALVFALFKAKIIPIIIDPGLEKSKLKRAIQIAEPDGFIGIPLAHVARLLLGWGKPSIKKLVTVGRRWFWGGDTLKKIREHGAKQPPFIMKKTHADDVAAILFTSGSTGIPKGAVYTHRNFIEQVNCIRDMFTITPGEIDLPTFPLFALFDPALEMTSVIPDMDFSKPGKANPEKLLEIMNDFGPTNMFASPALLDRLGRYCLAHHVSLSSLKRVITAGAPVQPKIIARFKKIILENAAIFTPYGATESLPVSVINGDDILEKTRSKSAKGFGTCVGKIAQPIDVKIIHINDSPIANWSFKLTVPKGQIGEIVVKGPRVTKRYYNMPRENKQAKIFVKGGGFYHRMGDLGYFDENNFLWYCGRKNHRVITKDKIYYSENCEGIFNQHPAVLRSGLTFARCNGNIEPVMCIELEKEINISFVEIKKELIKLGNRYEATRGIKYFLPFNKLPVDVRHNAKIVRETLAEWVKKEVLK